MARTPFGLVARGCTLEVPTGTLVNEDEHGLRLDHRTLGSWHHTPPSHCRQHSATAATATTTAAHATKKNITCSSLPCNNWIDNAGFQQAVGAVPIGGFSATYLVPATPTVSGDQVLFYFIGAENTDGQPRHGQPPPSGRAILQPVLTFDPAGWCFASWYCCPKNVTVHSAYVQDVTPFDTFPSSFNLSADGLTFTVTGVSTATGKDATLHCPRQGRNFNWADVTLEVYGVHGCDLFSPSRMQFTDVRLWDTRYEEIARPRWTLSPASPCGGSITVGPELHPTVHIEHSVRSPNL